MVKWLPSPGFRGGLVWHQDRPDNPIPLSPHKDSRSIAVSPDGRWVATGSHLGTKVKISDARTGDLVHELPVETGSDVGFSSDGRWLATTGGGCRLWAVGFRTGRPAHRWRSICFFGGWQTPGGGDRPRRDSAGRSGHRPGIRPAGRPQPGPLRPPVSQFGRHPAWSALPLTARRSTSGICERFAKQLAELGLDWDLPPYPPVDAKAARPLRAIVDMGNGERRK